MNRFCQVARKAVELKLMKALVENWRETIRKIVWTENVSGPQDGGYGDDTEPEKRTLKLKCAETGTGLVMWS